MKHLYRSRTNVMLAGVCGGVADYLGIDPTIVRVIWALLALSGTGVLAYLICALIMPEEP